MHLEKKIFLSNMKISSNQWTDSPVVVGTDGVRVLFITVTAGGIDGAARVGQLVRGVGDTHLVVTSSISIPARQTSQYFVVSQSDGREYFTN